METEEPQLSVPVSLCSRFQFQRAPSYCPPGGTSPLLNYERFDPLIIVPQERKRGIPLIFGNHGVLEKKKASQANKDNADSRLYCFLFQKNFKNKNEACDIWA